MSQVEVKNGSLMLVIMKSLIVGMLNSLCFCVLRVKYRAIIEILKKKNHTSDP